MSLEKTLLRALLEQERLGHVTLKRDEKGEIVSAKLTAKGAAAAKWPGRA